MGAKLARDRFANATEDATDRIRKRTECRRPLRDDRFDTDGNRDKSERRPALFATETSASADGARQKTRRRRPQKSAPNGDRDRRRAENGRRKAKVQDGFSKFSKRSEEKVRKIDDKRKAMREKSRGRNAFPLQYTTKGRRKRHGPRHRLTVLS